MSIQIKFEFNLTIVKGKCALPEKAEGLQKANEVDVKKEPGVDFLAAAIEEVQKLKSVFSPSTINNYQTAIRSFQKYLGGEDIHLDSICHDTMKSYERWLRDKGICLNTISCYMRSLRSLLSKIQHGNDNGAFSQVYIGRMKTEKRSIPESEITRLKEVRLKPSSYMALVRDLFIFSFYALGMPFVDIAFLRKDQIQNGILTYERHKTGQRIKMRLEPCMLDIINRYLIPDRPYVFPLLHSTIPKDAYNEYLSQLNRYNRSLKQLARIAAVDIPLTSYTPRHSWASIAFSHNVGIPVISKALGHANPNNTLTYIREINDNRLYEANSYIVNCV